MGITLSLLIGVWERYKDDMLIVDPCTWLALSLVPRRSLDPLPARSLGKSGRENSEYLSVTSQLTVESRIDRAEKA